MEFLEPSPASVMQDFKHIKAWQRAHALAIAIDKLSRGFSRAGYAYLRSQLNKSSDSISETIVEGCGADSNQEFARFLDMAIKSANETEGRLLKAKDFGLISHDDWERYTGETIEIRKMIFGYRKQVLKSSRAQKKTVVNRPRRVEKKPADSRSVGGPPSDEAQEV
jgi:four helix bundle protein